MDNQHYSQRPEPVEQPLPIIDLIILAIYIVGMIVFMAITVSNTFNAYKYPIRALLDAFSVIAAFQLPILAAKLFSRKRKLTKRRSTTDYKTLKCLCIIITVIGLLNAPMLFFDVGSTRPNGFFERREYIAIRDGLTVARVCDKDSYHYEAIAYSSTPCKGEVYPGTYAYVEFGPNGKTMTVKLE